jgi:hypothetical protein
MLYSQSLSVSLNFQDEDVFSKSVIKIGACMIKLFTLVINAVMRNGNLQRSLMCILSQGFCPGQM